ncbi:MAG: type III-A CRISPR-associated protein Cas10/Csm1 [Elusimicrobiota bacterium]
MSEQSGDASAPSAPRDRDSLILAALLHDAGKIGQRAAAPLDPSASGRESLFCPRDPAGRHPTHRHALWTEHLIRTAFGSSFPAAADLAAWHHNCGEAEGDRRLVRCLVLADWLASGERRERPEEDPPGESRTEPLVSPFALFKDAAELQPAFFPLMAMQFDPARHWPADSKEKSLAGKESYGVLWSGLKADLEALARAPSVSRDFDLLTRSLLRALERHALFVPSSAIDMPDVSLYHHLRLTAALAACLLDGGFSTGELDDIIDHIPSRRRPAVGTQTAVEVAALVKGDLSGIQDFLFSVGGEGAIKGLRGRSFYLDMLCMAAAERVLRSFDPPLPCVNVLFMGGGHFMLLAPWSAGVGETLERARDEVETSLMRLHRDRLGVSLAWTPVKAAEFIGDAFKGPLGRLGPPMAREKARMGSALLRDFRRRRVLLGPDDVEEKVRPCRVCGSDTGDPRQECVLCSGFEKAASALNGADSISIRPVASRGSGTPAPGLAGSLKKLGLELDLSGGETAVNQAGFREDWVGPAALIARYAPRDDHRGVLSLDKTAARAQGVKKWGALKLDVDDLESSLKRGIERPSISRFATLSALIHWFFTARIEYLLWSEFPHAHVVYSGGDDAFLLGPWSDLPVIAARLRQDLRDLTSGRLTLSAGIFLAPTTGFPVRIAALAACEALEKAKAREGKDAVSFLEEVLSWDELAECREVSRAMEALVAPEDGQDPVPRSLLTALGRAEHERLKVQDGQAEVFRIWRLVYAFAGMKERNRKRKHQLEALRKTVMPSDTGLVPHLGLMARWAGYSTSREG